MALNPNTTITTIDRVLMKKVNQVISDVDIIVDATDNSRVVFSLTVRASNM